MSRRNEASGTSAAPPLSDLMARYLERQASAHAQGLGPADVAGEVVPFEAVPVQPVDARLAWGESLSALHFLAPGIDTRSWQAPPDWPALVAAHEPAEAPAFCLGNFPQLVRNLQPLLHAEDLRKLRPTAGRPLAAPALLEWAAQAARKKDDPQILLALGCLRLARQFDHAAELSESLAGDVPAGWRAEWDNELAALSWHRGRAEEAAALWQAQPDSVPVHFNRGLAALFLGKPAEARPSFARAVSQLAEDDAWHHLGRLYMALAEMRA